MNEKYFNYTSIIESYQQTHYKPNWAIILVVGLYETFYLKYEQYLSNKKEIHNDK